jgi:hypothetical protein
MVPLFRRTLLLERGRLPGSAPAVTKIGGLRCRTRPYVHTIGHSSAIEEGGVRKELGGRS